MMGKKWGAPISRAMIIEIAFTAEQIPICLPPKSFIPQKLDLSPLLSLSRFMSSK
jgi:hypothetical protein